MHGMNDLDEFAEEAQARGGDSKRQGHPQINTRANPASNAPAAKRDAK